MLIRALNWGEPFDNHRKLLMGNSAGTISAW
jgi:hypothetical protein